MAVAYSGGRDSLALLHATCRAAKPLGLQVVAIHVHHGLMPQADDWLRAAQTRVARWRAQGWPVELLSVKLSGKPEPGDSVEAWARTGRHAALARLCAQAGASLLLLAHHRRDQAETVLLQLLRGAGAAGLAAMPASAERAGLVWARPWLNQPREAVDAYVRRHQLRPVQDPSNDQPRWARNRLRLQVWPALLSAFGDAEVSLAAAAHRAQEAQAVLADMAALDLAGCMSPSGRLKLPAWRLLSAARQANSLRHWWQQQAGRGAPETLLQRLLAELPGGPHAARSGARWPAASGWQATAYRGECWLQPVALALQDRPHGPQQGVLAQPPFAQITMNLSTPGELRVPAFGGAFQVTPCREGGLPLHDLQAVELRQRQGGERFQTQPAGLARSLKKQFQTLGMPAVQRNGPLLWRDGRLLFVPGLGIDARAMAPTGMAQCHLTWHPSEMDPVHQPKRSKHRP